MVAKIGSAFSLKLILGLTLILTSFNAFAQTEPKITASVDGQVDFEVTVGDTFTYSIAVSSPVSITLEEPRIPGFANFTLINAFGSQSTRSFYDQGQFQTEQIRQFNYALEAIKPGTFAIPPSEIVVNGKLYRTNAVQVKVLSGAGRTKPRQQMNQIPDDIDEMEEVFQNLLKRHLGPNAFGGNPGGQSAPRGQMKQIKPNYPINTNEAFFVHAEVDKTKAYVGEQITVTYYLFTRGQVTDIDTLKYPSLRGFWKEDLEMAARLNFEGVEVNGVPYQRALLVSYALFPIKAGRSQIDSYKAKCTVLSQTSFGFGRPYSFTKASRPIDIEVLDPPKEGRTSDYSGAVGTFKVLAGFDPSTVPVNQPATLRVKFEGRGNAKLIELPNLNLPPSMEIYDQKSDAKFFKDGTSYKVFEVLIIPREAGAVELPPVKTSVFNPETQSYEVIQSQPMRLQVMAGGAAPAPTVSTFAPEKSAKTEDGPPGLATNISGSQWWPQHRLKIWSIIYALLFFGIGVQLYKLFKSKPKKLNLIVLLKRRLKLVEGHIAANDVRRVGVELTNVVYLILGQISEQGGANLEIDRLLEKAPPSIRKELGDSMRKLLSQCETLSFAPEEIIKANASAQSMTDLKEKINSVMGRAIEMMDYQDSLNG